MKLGGLQIGFLCFGLEPNSVKALDRYQQLLSKNQELLPDLVEQEEVR